MAVEIDLESGPGVESGFATWLPFEWVQAGRLASLSSSSGSVNWRYWELPQEAAVRMIYVR